MSHPDFPIKTGHGFYNCALCGTNYNKEPGRFYTKKLMNYFDGPMYKVVRCCSKCGGGFFEEPWSQLPLQHIQYLNAKFPWMNIPEPIEKKKKNQNCKTIEEGVKKLLFN